MAQIAPSYDLSTFKPTTTLQNNTKNKSIALLGTFPPSTDNAIVLLEKKPFTEEDISTSSKEDNVEAATASPKQSFFNNLKVQVEFINNIYGSFECVPVGNSNAVKTTVVYPATEKHIEKYSFCKKFLVAETPQLYEDITLPFLTASQFSLEWVYNILEHKQETERIVYEDADTQNGFILLPDLKWDGRNVETLYLLVIPHKRDIKSLRDLNASHLPLLRNIRKRTAEVVEEKYEIDSTQLRMYVHYQPSFYHFHIHVNNLRNDAPGIWCEKSHMLDTIINNLELVSDYYQRATLPFVVFDGSKLFECFEKQVTVKKCLKRSRPEDSIEVSVQETTKQKRKKCDILTDESAISTAVEA